MTQWTRRQGSSKSFFPGKTLEQPESDWNNFTGTLEHSSSLQQPSGYPIKKKRLPKCWEIVRLAYPSLPHSCLFQNSVGLGRQQPTFLLPPLHQKKSQPYFQWPNLFGELLEGLVFLLPQPQTRGYFSWKLQGNYTPADSWAKRLQVKTEHLSSQRQAGVTLFNKLRHFLKSHGYRKM